jgi:nitronate monooxygenase
MKLPQIIQGGMGVGVSNWFLAREVSRSGQLGVVSGTAIDTIFVRRLQDGDPGGHMRRALKHFPIREVAEKFLKKYFLPEGRRPRASYRRIPMFSLRPSLETFELSVLANFTEIFLAKEGHKGLVGLNLLHKIQFPTISSLYGAMLAGVDYVCMGAGIPWDIPSILDKLSRHEPADMKVKIEGTEGDEDKLNFDPRRVMGYALPPLNRPLFLAIISSAVLAMALVKRCDGRLDGFVVEGALAGGHNAPPRGPLHLNERGEPVYGLRDETDLEKVRALGLPFWVAGACGTPEKLAEALSHGAAGVQVGTPFAFCRESAMAESVKQKILELVRTGRADIFTDPVASPTRFPFKVVRLDGTVSEPEIYNERHRICDLGYLRQAYRRLDGQIGYRCPSESPINYIRKGGRLEETEGRKCLCNGLLAAVNLAQVQGRGSLEPAIVTSGDDLRNLARYFNGTGDDYSARDVINYILKVPAAVPA